MDAIRSSDELLFATLEGDEEKTASMIEQAHQENTSILKYNDENALACVISLAYYSAKKDYLIYRELAGGKGYADMVFIPRNGIRRLRQHCSRLRKSNMYRALKGIQVKSFLLGLIMFPVKRKTESLRSMSAGLKECISRLYSGCFVTE